MNWWFLLGIGSGLLLLRRRAPALAGLDALPKDKQLDLIARFKAGDTKALDRLVEGNINLLWSRIRKHRLPVGVVAEDLLTAAYDGYRRALARFDPAAGTSPTGDYVVTAIDHAIGRELEQHRANASGVTVSRYMADRGAAAFRVSIADEHPGDQDREERGVELVDHAAEDRMLAFMTDDKDDAVASLRRMVLTGAISARDRDTVLALLEGKLHAEVAAEAGLARTAIGKRLSKVLPRLKLAMARRKQYAEQEFIQEARAFDGKVRPLVEQGLSQEEIAKKLGARLGRVERSTRRMGFALWNAAQARKRLEQALPADLVELARTRLEAGDSPAQAAALLRTRGYAKASKKGIAAMGRRLGWKVVAPPRGPQRLATPEVIALIDEQVQRGVDLTTGRAELVAKGYKIGSSTYQRVRRVRALKHRG